MPLDERVPIVTKQSAEYLTERQTVDYQLHREDLLEWLSHFGKSTEGSKTYIEFQSDGTEAQQAASDLARRGGRIREGVEDVDELYAQPTPLLAKVLFDDDPVPLVGGLELDEDDWDACNDE